MKKLINTVKDNPKISLAIAGGTIVVAGGAFAISKLVKRRR